MNNGIGMQNKVIAITGAGGGLGRAAALAMAADGAKVVLTDADAASLAETARLVRAAKGEAIEVVGDVTLEETHSAWVSACRDNYRRLDGLCNVAGILGPGSLEDVTPALFDRVLHVNCLGPLLAVKHAAPLLKETGGAAIVNVSSVGGLVALPMMAVYCASKAAVIGLTRALAAELAPHVRCNAVCPGGIDTPMAQSLLASVPADQREDVLAKLTGRQLIKRFATAQEIASTLVFLVSDQAAFVTGAVLAADGGHSAS